MEDGFSIPTRMPRRKDIPVLKGYIKDEQLHVWCPFCRTWHHHGAKDGRAIMQGHRVAHCHHPDSPFRKNGTGYYIRVFTKQELRDIR